MLIVNFFFYLIFLGNIHDSINTKFNGCTIVVSYDPKVCFSTFDNLNYNLEIIIESSIDYNLKIVCPNYRNIENESISDHLTSLGLSTNIYFDNTIFNEVVSITGSLNSYYIANYNNNVILFGNLETSLLNKKLFTELIPCK